MRLFAPIGPLGVVEGLGAEEFAVKNLGLRVNVILNLRFVSQVVGVLANCEVVILDRIFRIGLGSWYKVFLVHFAHWLSKLVSDDVPIPDLLVDRWVVNQSAIYGSRRLVLGGFLVHQICRLSILNSSGTSCTDNPIIHQLEVLIRLLLTTNGLARRVPHDELVCGDPIMISAIHGSPSAERRDASRWIRLTAGAMHKVAPIVGLAHLLLRLLHLHV